MQNLLLHLFHISDVSSVRNTESLDWWMHSTVPIGVTVEIFAGY
jgi:hypothetical protein